MRDPNDRANDASSRIEQEDARPTKQPPTRRTAKQNESHPACGARATHARSPKFGGTIANDTFDDPSTAWRTTGGGEWRMIGHCGDGSHGDCGE